VLLSMTGFGDATLQEGALAVAVEVRTVNNATSSCDQVLRRLRPVLKGKSNGSSAKPSTAARSTSRIRVDRGPQWLRLPIECHRAFQLLEATG